MSPSLEVRGNKVEAPLRHHGVVHAELFGSVARGDDRAGRDVDFRVEFEPGRSVLDLAVFQVEIRETLGCDVDAATRKSLPPGRRDRILRGLVPLP